MLRLSQRFVWASHTAVTTARCSVRRHAAAVATARAGTPTLPSEWRVSAQWRGLHVARPVLSEDDEDTSAAGGDEGVADDNDQFLADMRSEVWMQVNKAGVDADAFPENPYTSRVAYSPTWTTDKGDPQQHTADDVGLFYDLPSELASVFPDGTPGTLEAEEFATTCQTSLMIRDQGVELIDLMKKFKALRSGAKAGEAASEAADGVEGGEGDESAAEPEIDLSGFSRKDLPTFQLLDGPRGIGKSSILTHIIHYARTNGWVTMVIPSGWDLMNGGFVLTKSRTNRGMVDQHDIAISMLQTMLELHGDQLAMARQKGNYSADRYLPTALDEQYMTEAKQLRDEHVETVRRLKAEAAATGSSFDESQVEKKVPTATQNINRRDFTLRDMVDWGLRHPALATDALLALKTELQKTRRFPVLIAIDGLNHLYEPTPYFVEGKRVEPQQLSIANAFRALGPGGFEQDYTVNNGLMVATTSLYRYHHLERFNAQVKRRAKHHKVVPRLTRPEIHSMLKHYAASGRFFLLHDEELVDANEVEYYRQMSDAVPERIYDCAMYH